MSSTASLRDNNSAALKARLEKDLDTSKGVSVEQAWEEFEKRCEKSDLKEHLILGDLLWDIASSRWPRQRKKRGS